MQATIKYLWYILKHKWLVWQECRKYGLIWRGLIHDWSKFRPSEFGPFRDHFFTKKDAEKDWQYACNLHYQRNKHHPEHWLFMDKRAGIPTTLEIPEMYLIEMVCDWNAMSKARGALDARQWYRENKHKIRLHARTRRRVEELLGIVDIVESGDKSGIK